jgi:hypothetical protein
MSADPDEEGFVAPAGDERHALRHRWKVVCGRGRCSHGDRELIHPKRHLWN